jgi:hypothetical protein
MQNFKTFSTSRPGSTNSLHTHKPPRAPIGEADRPNQVVRMNEVNGIRSVKPKANTQIKEANDKENDLYLD